MLKIGGWVTIFAMFLASECAARIAAIPERVCRLEMGHFDQYGGGLRVHPDDSELLRDGLPLAIFEDTDLDGRASFGDRELTWPESKRAEMDQWLRTNGTARFDHAGFFFANHVSLELPTAGIYIRVWNAESRTESSGSWVSPVTQLRTGYQQISFLSEEWDFIANANPTSLNPPQNNSPDVPPHPTESRLVNCYPNPFNATATVQFTLAFSAPVRLEIFDLQGRLVRETLAQHFEAGAHQLPIEGSGLSSGSYFVSLLTDQHRIGITRIQLLK